jgi:hypothetical protein
MADIDLRPKPGEPLYEVLRLGMTFDNVNNDGLYTFTRYADNLIATFNGIDATEITFTDRTSTLSKTYSMSEVTSAAAVLTVQSKPPFTVTPPDTSTEQ